MGTAVAGDVLARLPQRGRSGGGRASFPPVVRGAWRIALARRRRPPPRQPSRAGLALCRGCSMAVEEEGLRVFQSVRIKIGTVRGEREAADQQRERGETGDALRVPGGRSGAPARAAWGSEALSLAFLRSTCREKGEPEEPAAFLGCAGRARSVASSGLGSSVQRTAAREGRAAGGWWPREMRMLRSGSGRERNPGGERDLPVSIEQGKIALLPSRNLPGLPC